MTPSLPRIPYAQLVQICGGVYPTLPHYERRQGLVFAYLPHWTTRRQWEEVVTQIRHLWPGTTYHLVGVLDVPPERVDWNDPCGA